MSNIHKNKLDCKIIEDLLPLYHDGVVNDTTKNAVEDHLNDCSNCKAEYEKYSKDIPTYKSKSTSKEFALLMRKKRIKQVLTVIIVSILSCSVLAGGYFLLFKAHIKPIDDIEVKCVYKYTDDEPYSHKKINKFFIVSSSATNTSTSYRSRYYKENGKVILEHTDYGTVMADSLDEKQISVDSLTVVDFSADGADKYPDVDVFILNGKEVWSKEKNGDDELPGFIDGWIDFENGNNDEFGDSDTISWVTGEDFLQVNYDYSGRSVRWDYDGNVLYDSAEKEQDK